MYRILLILYIIWGGVSIASGQDFNYSFTQLSTNQGLSQASVTSVTMDQKGRLWIGTQSGLNYYFQQQLKTFIHHESDSLSLPNNYINHIVEDSLGTIWVATSKEMVLYNSDNHNFTPTGYNCIYSSLCIEGGILFGSENIIFRYNYKSRTMDSIYICQLWKSHPINQRRKSVINIAKEKMQSKKRICKCLLPNSIYRFLFILFLQNEHVLYFSNAFINSFFTVSTPGKPVCF